MGFWKSLFTTTDATAAPKTAEPDRYTTSTMTVGNSRIFFSTDREIDLYELEELCDAVGWSRRPLRKVKKAIQHSFLVVSMWEQRGAQRRLVGFSRATSDHAFNATIWDVVVHPDFQGKGCHGRGRHGQEPRLHVEALQYPHPRVHPHPGAQRARRIP